MKRTQIISGCAVLISLLASSQPSQAVLGGSADTISSDRTALQAVHRASTSRSGYSVEEITSDATTVREFVSPSGVVFGIAWNGFVHPDLMQLLGTYWNEYKSVQQKSERAFGRKRQKLTTSTIVVEKWGHMRNLQGRAYLPSMIPAGVTIDEIK
jgi:hypothetical protein